MGNVLASASFLLHSRNLLVSFVLQLQPVCLLLVFVHMQEEVDALRAQLADKEQQLAEAIDAVDIAEAKISSLAAQYAGLEADLAEAAADVADATADLAGAESAAAAAEAAAEAARAAMEEQQAALAREVSAIVVSQRLCGVCIMCVLCFGCVCVSVFLTVC